MTEKTTTTKKAADGPACEPCVCVCVFTFEFDSQRPSGHGPWRRGGCETSTQVVCSWQHRWVWFLFRFILYYCLFIERFSEREKISLASLVGIIDIIKKN